MNPPAVPLRIRFTAGSQRRCLGVASLMLLLGGLLLAGCDSSTESQQGPIPDLSGPWAGSTTSDTGSSFSFGVDLQQSDRNLWGTFDVAYLSGSASGDISSPSGSVYLDMTAGTVQKCCDEFGCWSTAQFQINIRGGTLNGDAINAPYAYQSYPCHNDIVEADLQRVLPPPIVPAGITISGGDGQATFSWDAIPGAVAYGLAWSTDLTAIYRTGPFTRVAASVTSVTQTLNNNQLYYFLVYADLGNGDASSLSKLTAVTPKPAASGVPSPVAAKAGNQEITLTWSPVSGAISYNLYWSFAPGVTKVNRTLVANVVSPYTLSGLTTGYPPYYFVITAEMPEGESGESPEVGATP